MPCVQIILLSVTSWVTLSTFPRLALCCVLNNVNNSTCRLGLLQCLVEAVLLKHCECYKQESCPTGQVRLKVKSGGGELMMIIMVAVMVVTSSD